MKLNPLSALLDTLQAASDNGSEQATADGGAVGSGADGADGADGSDPSGGVLNVDLPSGQPATLSVDADADPDAIRDAVEASGGSVRGVQGQTDDGTVIPVSTEGEDLDLSDTFFDDEDFEFDFITDSRIQDVRDRQVEYNQRVGRYIMHKDDLVPSIKERIKGLLLGEDGLSVEPVDPDDDADQQLADHMEDIYNGRSDVGPSVNPADVVGDMLDQNFQNARWVGRATDLRYLDLESLELVVDGQTGERLYVQDATDYTTFSIDEDTEQDAVDFDLERSDPHALKVGDEVLDAQLYDRPPLEAVVDDVIGKMEMKFLKARKAQIGSVGGLFIKVGTPDYLPEDEYFDRVPNPFTDGDDDTITKLERELQQGIDNAFSTLEDYRSGTVMAIPNNWEVQQVELPDTGESLDEQIRGYNKSIARRLLYPLDLVELQSGAELSRQTLFRTVLNTLQGWRSEIRSVFDSFADVQKEVHDLNGDVTHSFPTLQNEDEELLVSALKYAGPAGMSESEIRQTLNTLEGFDLDTDRDTGDMPPAGGPADPQQRQDSMDDMLPDQPPDGSDTEPDQQPPDGSDGGSDGDMQGLQAYTPPEGLDLNDLDGWTQASVWDAFLSVGGTFSTCVTEMTGELRNPQGFCAALKDEALGTDLWRKGSGADGAALSGGAAASVWAADPQTVETTATLSEVADALSEASDGGLTELQREDDYVAFSGGGSDPQGEDFSPVVVVDSGEDQYDLSGVSRDVADSVRDMLSDGAEGSGRPDSPDDAETALARLSGQSDGSDGSGPFSMIPGVPDNPDRITRDMLNQVAKWKLQQMKQAQGALPDAVIRDPPDVEAFTRTYNPALHPRNPDTGQFVERPFSVVDDLSELSEDSIDNADTSEVVGFLHDSPGEPDMNDVLQDDGITIDGIPDDISTVEELRNRSETPETDEDVPTNPRTFEQVGLGSILKAPDGDPVEVVGRDVYSDDRIMTVERPDGTRDTIDMDAMRRNTIDEYNAEDFSDLPSQQSGGIEDLSVEDISPADPRFVTDLDKPQVEEGDFLRVDPRTFADEPTGEKFVAEVTEKRFRGAEFTVRKPDGSEIDIGAGTEYNLDAHLQPAPEVTSEVDLSGLDPSDPSEGFVRELSGSDVVNKLREGDVVTFRESRDADPQFAEVVDDGSGINYTLLTPDGERVRKTQGDGVKIDGKYTPPVEPAVDPDTFVGEDGIGTKDLSDMPDNLTPSERRERTGGEYLSDDVINEEMVQQEEIPEGSFIAREVGENDAGRTGTRVKKVIGYTEKNYTDEKFIETRSSSGRAGEIKASKVELEGYRAYTPADEPTTTIPEEDWSEDPEERQQAVKSLLDDVTVGGTDGPDKNDDGDIPDDTFELAKEQISEHLSRAKDKEHAETVAARLTSIGDDIARAHAVKQFTAWGTPTAYYSVSDRGKERVNHHELGHAIGDAYGVAGGSNDMDGQTFPMPDFAWLGDDVANKYGLKPPQGSDQFEDGISPHSQDAYNLDQWKDEVDEQVGNGMDGRNFTGVDSVEETTEAEMLYLSSEPGLNEPRTFSIVEHDPDDFTDDSSRSGHKVRLEDRQGNQHNAVIRDRFGEVNVQWEDTSEYSRGTSDEVQGTRKTMQNQWREDPPDPDEHLSDDLPDGSTEDRFRNLADTVNKSWYRQAAAAREQSLDRAARYSIKDGYSTKQAHETMSRIHEVMRSDGIDRSTRAEAAKTLVKYHPDLLQAYRGVYDPPDRMKSMLNQVLKQEGAEYRFDDDGVSFATKEQQRITVAGLYGDN